MSRLVRCGPVVLAVAVALAAPSPVRAQPARSEGPTPPRLARADGTVSFWRTGAEDWAPAQVNTPLAAGDRLYASGRSQFEIELAARAVVRGGADTEVAVASLETGYLQLEVTSGQAALDFQRLPEGQRVEVDTPNGVFLIDRAGYYRVDVTSETRFVVRRGGEAYVVPAGGAETPLGDGRQIVLSGSDPARVALAAAPAPDAFDAWNDARFAALPAQPRSTQHVAASVAGADDLDRYGTWESSADYGQVWVPQDVGPDWAPYTTGRWVYDPYYDWTWVDDAPWGWAPYHYGRWVNTGAYWGWAPGPVVARPVYAPALVGFVGGYGYGGGVGVSVDVASPIGWVALAFGEPCLPWWGPLGFRGRPWWGGWGGPRYVNNIYIDNRRIVNVDRIDGWRNARYRNAVSAVRGDRFGRGRGDRLHLREDERRRLRPLRDLRVRPERASLVARDGRGVRPPERIRNRAVT
ncbi:MAG: hypothetical protein KIT14_12460, partial [bacterium]|nr:hypothetical protein [bacterium]